jgi:hypothetical protein
MLQKLEQDGIHPAPEKSALGMSNRVELRAKQIADTPD